MENKETPTLYFEVRVFLLYILQLSFASKIRIFLLQILNETD